MTLSAYVLQIKDWWRAARGNKLFWRGLGLAALIVLLDQASKYWIVHGIELPRLNKIEISAIFDLSYVENRGASFGMLHGMRWVLSLISIGVALGLGVWLGKLKRPVAAFGVAFVIGGALGNLYDRLAYGYVVDFLDFSAVPFPNFARIEGFPFIEVFIGGFIWVFNVADAAINVGIAFLLLDAWRTGRADKQAEKRAE
ncbi:signal peptidase II [Hyphococcus sp.]|uniref:signal peptidase II n=1 Tax=Hyphococcus sp. TaxID=2038636 RepID=UPI002084CDDD|nr:MAG: lipoprotein signal peptidase [Marinicaulis sp.]